MMISSVTKEKGVKKDIKSEEEKESFIFTPFLVL